MPSAVSPNPRAGSAAPDDVDNLFNYDDAVEDFLKDLPIDKSHSNDNFTAQEPAKNIDEEITVKKKRKRVPKLDEARLTSQAGIPRLRRITKSRLKFRGKGHEFSDISRLLNTHQLWLDDLFPRAKFRDALSTVEKLGHSKRMQMTRKGWLDATKPYQRETSPERVEDVEMSGALPGSKTGGEQRNNGDESDDAIFGDSLRPNEAVKGDDRRESSSNNPEEADLDALFAEQGTSRARKDAAPERSRGPFEEDDDPNEDELDALLAERPSGVLNGSLADGNEQGKQSSNNREPDGFADDEEAMAGMDDLW